MNVLVLLVVTVALFAMAIRFYGKAVEKWLGADADRKTPAHEVNDGVDYVPTRPHVLFAHHFSAIAGAGPIVGPVVAIIYGYGPAWLWILIGGIFIGATHDFSALFVSAREGGRSMADVARRAMGLPGFVLFILFVIVQVVLVNSAFLSLSAISLTSKYPVERLGLAADQTLLHTVTADGVTYGVIGGIASTSAVFITLCAPFLGYLLFKRHLRTAYAYVLASILCLASVALGLYWPVQLDTQTWMVIISVYTIFAAGAPVWIILQPRDFVNVQILYVGTLALVASIVIGGAGGLSLASPAWNVAEGTERCGMIWPTLFVLIACGAISGFHAMVAGGTTAKQLASEAHARKIGYNAMLLESVLAVCVILAIGSCLALGEYRDIVYPSAPGVASNPVLAFAVSVGELTNRALGVPKAYGTILGILLLEGFVVTTLDAAVRLNRYFFEELWRVMFGVVNEAGEVPGKRVPWPLSSFWFNSGLSVVLMGILAYFNAWRAIWPLFGSGNQLLAALTLLTISIWLLKRGRQAWFTIVPAAFMVVTTIASLFYLLFTQYLPKENWTLLGADVALLVLALGMGALVAREVRGLLRESAPGGAGADPAEEAAGR